MTGPRNTPFSADALRVALKAMEKYHEMPKEWGAFRLVCDTPRLTAAAPGESLDFHLKLADEAGMVQLRETGNPRRLTFDGRLFLDETGDPRVWQVTKVHIDAYGLRSGERLIHHIMWDIAEKKAERLRNEELS